MRRRRLRVALFLPVLAGFAAFLFWGLAGLPDFGRYDHAYGNLLIRVAPVERHTTNVVSAVVFDYRGVDTMAEELILFTAVLGVALLLRSAREEEQGHPVDSVTSDAVRAAGALGVLIVLMLGLWIVTYGYITPGGGFQGGVILASSPLLLWAAISYRSYGAFTPPAGLAVGKGIGGGGYVVVGILGLAVFGTFLHNLFDPGTTGTLRSGGSIALLNWAAAIEVAAAMLVLFSEFLAEYAEPLASRQNR